MTDTLLYAEGFLRTVVDFIVKHDGVWDEAKPSSFQPSEVSQHVIECGVKHVFDVNQDIVLEAETDSYGRKKDVARSYVTANYNCHCGQYALIHSRVRGTIGGIMYDIKQVREPAN